MSSFEERWGKLTVGEALELNKKAKNICSFETTNECDIIE